MPSKKWPFSIDFRLREINGEINESIENLHTSQSRLLCAKTRRKSRPNANKITEAFENAGVDLISVRKLHLCFFHLVHMKDNDGAIL